ncbi:MAG: hypothetical protein IPP57_21395 [Candidatus Obscuribacter sp.]|nr:hypothetical protein [Candidatus Obscuribacter sp.]MBK9205858.1 hypothetical protein [Candidatus Obscuribacter sp.]MBK9617798.1 hypothetical protein [Candidatus Obscuribacter sp.]MBK9773337.1 hypothetical protein [Candidatus Obscuribacter sp.]MDQ5965665.1 hypothetical protein [Cyanobacteriota bacterium erpe_2018_sw_39hr_WHONDRS-SW48-000098_B_bin.30]
MRLTSALTSTPVIPVSERPSMLDKQATADALPTLLLGASIVSQQKLDEAMTTAKSLNVPLPRALAMLNLVGEATIKIVLEAEELVRSNKATVDLALKALRLARQNNMTMDDAIGVITSVHKKTQTVQSITNPLTELLLSSELITNEQLGRSIIQAKDTGMQMGRIMVLNRDLSGWMMNAALTAQLLVRDGRITKDQAIQGLQIVGRRRVSVEQALFELGYYSEKAGQTVRIGELVLMAGFLSEGDMLECMEIELVKEKQFGQILLEQGLVTHDLLEAAIVLQDMVSNNTLKAFQAAEALKNVKARSVMVYQAVAELYQQTHAEPKEFLPAKLLVEAGLISDEDIRKVADISEKSAIKVGKKVLSTGAISETILYTALRTYSLYHQGFISAEQATNCLRKCKLESLTLDETLSKLGLTVPARMQWIWS